MKNILLILSCFVFACINAQTTCDSLVQLPETFDLGKLTDSTRFKPDFPAGVPDGYVLEISDRWGQKVFSTDIPQQGWNGLHSNHKGVIASGTYMWSVECAWDADSVYVNCTGFVNCINTGVPVTVTPLDTLHCRPEVYMPNAFTPNGDGLHDALMPQLGCPPVEYELQIYDRWGELVFATTNAVTGWDGNLNGRPAQMDIYVWRIHCRFYEGDKKRDYTGQVTLIR